MKDQDQRDSPESRHFPRARSSRSRSRHERAREERAAQGQPPTFYSSANPAQPLPAQEECISRPVRDQANVVGRVNATPHADPDDVMLDMNSELCLAEMPVFFPREASEWQAVDYVLMQPQPPVGRAVVVDLRQDTWERYQYPRTMPVMEEGVVVTYLVVPDGLSMRQVQTRVNAWSTGIDLYIVMALDCYQWIVNRVTIPDSYRNAILEQRQRDLALPRGGAEFLYPIPVHIPVPQERKLIFTIFAHDPFQVNAYYIKKNTRLWHVMDHLEGEHHAWGRIRISTMLFPIHLTAKVWNLPGGVLVTHFLDREQQPGYHSFFQIDWYANDRWAAATESQQEWPPRGGTRSRQTVDQRAQMQVWALDRIQEFYPQLPTTTATFLLRSEARTASSILNSRSGIQVTEVVEAALRRAGLRREWFLQSSAVDVASDSPEDQRTTSTVAAHASGQDQVVILLLSLQNQVAGQWQAINALSSSVVQMRNSIAAAQSNLNHDETVEGQTVHRSEETAEGQADTQDYEMLQTAEQALHQAQQHHQTSEQQPRASPATHAEVETEPPTPVPQQTVQHSQQLEVPDQDEDMQDPQPQPLSPTPVYSQPNMDEEVVQVSDSEHSDNQETHQQQDQPVQASHDNDADPEPEQHALVPTASTEQILLEPLPATPSEQRLLEPPPEGNQRQSLSQPAEAQSPTLYARLGSRAQRVREGPPAGALRPFRH